MRAEATARSYLDESQKQWRIGCAWREIIEPGLIGLKPEIMTEGIHSTKRLEP